MIQNIKMEELQEQINELQEWKESMESSYSIPLNIDQAFRARFSGASLANSTKSASSENQPVNEGGVATYDVLKPPDAFLQVNIQGTVCYIPIFT